MTEGASDLRRRDVRQGLIANVLTTVAQGFKWLLLSLLVSILLEWAGMVLCVAGRGVESQPKHARRGDRLPPSRLRPQFGELKSRGVHEDGGR